MTGFEPRISDAERVPFQTFPKLIIAIFRAATSGVQTRKACHGTEPTRCRQTPQEARQRAVRASCHRPVPHQVTGFNLQGGLCYRTGQGRSYFVFSLSNSCS